MSVIITNFNNITLPTPNAQEVLAWLQDNATEYFTGFDIRSDYYIQCKLGEENSQQTVLELSTNGGAAGIIRGLSMAHDEYFDSIWHGNNTCIAKACATTYGIALKFASMYDTAGTTTVTSDTVFISKTDQGDTCIVGWSGLSLGYPYDARIKCCDFATSVNVLNIGQNIPTTTYIEAVKSYLKTLNPLGKTTLTPICFDRGTYAPNIFITNFTQLDLAPYQDFIEVDIDGTRYLYDGLLALKG